MASQLEAELMARFHIQTDAHGLHHALAFHSLASWQYLGMDRAFVPCLQLILTVSEVNWASAC